MRERLVRLKLQWDRIAKEIGELQNRMAPWPRRSACHDCLAAQGPWVGQKPPNWNAHHRDFQRPVHVDSNRPDCADTLKNSNFGVDHN
jgi:hypothetical protein